MINIKELIVVSIYFLIFDYVWLSYFFKNYWTTMISRIQLSQFKANLNYAVFSYILMTLSVLIFVLPKIGEQNTFLDSIKYGGLMGLIIYGIFDFTNLAIFERYSVGVGLADVAWGTFLFTLVTYLTKKTMLKLKYLI